LLLTDKGNIGFGGGGDIGFGYDIGGCNFNSINDSDLSDTIHNNGLSSDKSTFSQAREM
jgi:hypothetical protein